MKGKYQKYGSRYYGGNRVLAQKEHSEYVKFVAPNLLASFALVLKEYTDADSDTINMMLSAVNALWEQSIAEGWDIRERCERELDIDVMHRLEAKERGLL